MNRIVAFFLALMLSISVSAQDSLNVRMAGSMIFNTGWVYDVEVVDDLAYEATSRGLAVLDVSTPSNPTIIGLCEITGHFERVAVAGNLAFLVEPDAGLHMVNIADPEHPYEVSFVSMPHIQDVAAEGDYAYVASGWDGLRIIDASQPNDPQEVVCWNTTRYVRQIVLTDGYACLQDDGLTLIDRTNPAIPFEVCHCPSLNLLHFAVDQDYLYAVRDDFHVVDISDPFTPEYLGQCDLPVQSFHLAAGDGFACVVDEGGIRVIDTTNPSAPQMAGSIVVGTQLPTEVGVSIQNDYAYVAAGYLGLRIFDLTDATNPNEVGYCDLNEPASAFVVENHFAFLAASYSGFWMIDISNPAFPFECGSSFSQLAPSWSEYGSAWTIAVHDTTVFLAGHFMIDYMMFRPRIWTFSISSPGNPQPMDCIQSQGEVNALALSQGYAYAAVNQRYPSEEDPHGLQVLDVTDPTEMSEVSYSPLLEPALDVAVADNYAYVANGAAGLSLFDISDAAHPEVVGASDTPDSAQGIAVSNGYAYLADGESGLRIIDISDPAAPIETGSWDSPGQAHQVAVRYGYAYLADGSAGLRVIDVADPTHPTETGYFDTPGCARDVKLWNGYAIVADEDRLLVLDCSDAVNVPETRRSPRLLTYSLVQPYPNPFNASLLIRYNLGSSAAIGLSVFDLLGRKVATLDRGMRGPGEHTVQWDAGQGVASGVYFIRLQTGESASTRRVQLVR